MRGGPKYNLGAGSEGKGQELQGREKRCREERGEETMDEKGEAKAYSLTSPGASLCFSVHSSRKKQAAYTLLPCSSLPGMFVWLQSAVKPFMTSGCNPGRFREMTSGTQDTLKLRETRSEADLGQSVDATWNQVQR